MHSYHFLLTILIQLNKFQNEKFGHKGITFQCIRALFPLYDAVRIWSHTVQYHKYKDTLVPEIKSNQNWHNSICVDFNCSTFHLSDIPTYLSAWFQHTFNSSAMNPSQQGNALSPQQWFYLWQMYWPNLAPWCAATQVWISSCSGCVTDALMVFSHPSGQAHSFCHSTSSMVTAALSAPTHSYLPKWHSNAPAHVVHQKSMQILCHMFGSYIALISTHMRLFTHCPQTQSGQCYYSQCPNTDLLQSSLNVGDPVARRGPYEWCCLPYTANRLIVTCDSTLGWGTWYFLSLLLILWPLCRLAASLPTGAPTDYTTYIQILTFQFTNNAVSIQHT